MEIEDEEDFEWNFEDAGLLDDFADMLMEILTDLQDYCDTVIKDCDDRKTRLTNAIIWGMD